MKVAIYTRVSTIEQAEEGYSISEQQDKLKKLYYWQIEQLSGYGKTRMYELLNLGCLEFAQKLKDMTDIDLLEYKE